MYRKLTASLAVIALASGLAAAAFAQDNSTSQPPQPPSPQGQGMMGGQGSASGQGMMGGGNMMPMMAMMGAMTRMMDTCNRTMESANHAPAVGGSGNAAPGTAH